LQQEDHQLPGAESHRGIQRRTAAARGISKQGNTMVRWLLIERCIMRAQDPDCGRLSAVENSQRTRGGEVAIARKLAVRMYWDAA